MRKSKTKHKRDSRAGGGFSYSCHPGWKNRDGTDPQIHGNQSNSRLDCTDNTAMLAERPEKPVLSKGAVRGILPIFWARNLGWNL